MFGPSRWRATFRPIALTLVLLLPLGCMGGGGVKGTSAHQQEIRNLRTSIELMRDSMNEMASEREAFQEKYLTAASELRTHKTDVGYLEARVRRLFQEIAGLEAQLDESEQLLSATRQRQGEGSQLVRALQDANARLKERIDEVNTERVKLEEQLEESVARADDLERERKSLRQTVDQSQAELAAELQERNERIAELKAEALQLKGELAAATMAAESTPPAVGSPSTSPAVTVEKAPPPEPLAFMTGWWSRSVAEIQRGTFNSQNLLLLGLVIGVLLLALLALVNTRRAKRWKQRARQAAEAVPAPAPAAAATPQTPAAPAAPRVRTRSVVLPRGSRTVPVPSPNAEQEARSQAKTVAVDPKDNPWTADTEDVRKVMREDIGADLTEAAPSPPPAPPPAESQEDELLDDLKELISKNIQR